MTPDIRSVRALAFTTPLGEAYLDDAALLLPTLPPRSVRLIVSSPPFALDDSAPPAAEASGPYAEWLLAYLELFERLLVEGGHVVLEMGSAWRGRRERSIGCFEAIVRACRDGGWHLLQEFYWYNPSSLVPVTGSAPDDRFRDSVSMCWWVSRTTEVRPHMDRVARFNNSLLVANSNLLLFAPGPDEEAYGQRCREAGLQAHQQAFPSAFAAFFVELLTEPGDVVLDPFAGSCTSGLAAERSGRRWICVERDPKLFRTAIHRFDPKPSCGGAS